MVRRVLEKRLENVGLKNTGMETNVQINSSYTGEGCIRKMLDCNQADLFLNLFIHAKPIGGDLVQVLGDGVGALAPKFFLLSPKMRNLGGDSLYLRNKCWLSIIMY